jgi:hypothetical protein
MLHPPPAKINTARRAPVDSPSTVSAVPTRPDSHQKCKSRDTWKKTNESPKYGRVEWR